MSDPKVKCPNDRLRIGFVGAGNMATAICEGLINSSKAAQQEFYLVSNVFLLPLLEYVKPEQIYASAPSNNNIRRFKVQTPFFKFKI